MRHQLISLFLLLPFVVGWGCTPATHYRLVETDSMGKELRTHSLSNENKNQLPYIVSQHFAAGQNVDVIRWGNAFLALRDREREFGTPQEDADVSMMIALAHLFLVKPPSDLETIYINNGHIKAAMEKLQRVRKFDQGVR
jgi:hypothetical protein